MGRRGEGVPRDVNSIMDLLFVRLEMPCCRSPVGVDTLDTGSQSAGLNCELDSLWVGGRLDAVVVFREGRPQQLKAHTRSRWCPPSGGRGTGATGVDTLDMGSQSAGTNCELDSFWVGGRLDAVVFRGGRTQQSYPPGPVRRPGQLIRLLRSMETSSLFFLVRHGSLPSPFSPLVLFSPSSQGSLPSRPPPFLSTWSAATLSQVNVSSLHPELTPTRTHTHTHTFLSSPTGFPRSASFVVEGR